MAQQIPMVDYLVLDGDPHLSAQECKQCGALYFDRRSGCAHRGGAEFGRRDLAVTGVVCSFAIIHQAGPGVPVPYISPVVDPDADADADGSVKANVLSVEPEPDNLSLGMKVQLKTFVAGTDDDGTEAIAFGFEPVEQHRPERRRRLGAPAGQFTLTARISPVAVIST